MPDDMTEQLKDRADCDSIPIKGTPEWLGTIQATRTSHHNGNQVYVPLPPRGFKNIRRGPDASCRASHITATVKHSTLPCLIRFNMGNTEHLIQATWISLGSTIWVNTLARYLWRILQSRRKSNHGMANGPARTQAIIILRQYGRQRCQGEQAQ